jgi:Zn-dependent protease with chaperone function
MSLRPDVRDFPGLSHRVFQHPLDSQATATLARVPMLPKLAQFLSEKTVEQARWSHHVASALQLGPDQYASLYSQFVRLAQVLDLPKLPELYINNSPEVNASSAGIESYTIVLCRGLLDALTEDEVLAVLAHELGHVKCNHVLYKTVASDLQVFGFLLLDQIPGFVGLIAKVSIGLAVFDWYRKSELSCDRAAVLATQDPESVQRALAKLAGFSTRSSEPINLTAVIRQAQRYEDAQDSESMLAKLMRLQMLLSESHPYPIVRVKEVAEWADSSLYHSILTGQYRVEGSVTWDALATPSGLACPKCSAAWESQTPFCGACGTSLRDARAVCGKCFVPVELAWRACPACGRTLVQTP